MFEKMLDNEGKTYPYARYFPIALFAKGYTDYSQKKWISPKEKQPECDSGCRIWIKFADGREGKGFYHNTSPNWWYGSPDGRNQLFITEEIKFWKGLTEEEMKNER